MIWLEYYVISLGHFKCNQYLDLLQKIFEKQKDDTSDGNQIQTSFSILHIWVPSYDSIRSLSVSFVTNLYDICST